MKAGLGKQERKLLDQLAAEECTVVRAEDITNAANVDQATANAILSRLTRKGWLQRIKRGVYAIVPLGSSTETPAIANAWPIATNLFEPCIISGWTAAEHWGLTDQIFNVVSIVTSKPQRSKDQEIGGIRFRVRTLPLERVFGSKTKWFGIAKVNIADPHRTIIDILDAPDFGGGGRHVMDIVQAYWTGRLADPTKILEYAERYGRGTVFKRLGFTAEQYGQPSDDWIDRCKVGCSRGISLLDPYAPNAGSIRTRWGIRINIPIESR